MKRISSILLALYMSIAIFAEKVQIGDLYYELNTSNLTASVVHNYPSYSQLSNLIIPAYVSHQGLEYRVTSIGEDAFWTCYSLTSVTIPNSITSIGIGAFHSCHGLTSVIIPNSVTNIGKRAFANCTSLISIDVDANNANYCAVDGVLFSIDTTTLLQYPGGKQGAYTIPNNVTRLENHAFDGCAGLTSIEIPSNIENVFAGFNRFGNVNLKSVILNSNNVLNVNSVSSVFGRQVEYFTIGENITSIVEKAFSDCPNLISISVDENNPNYCAVDGVLYNKDTTILYRCPSKKQGAYIIPSSVTSIEVDAFRGCADLTEITIPNHVISIGEDAFSACVGIASLSVPNCVTAIGGNAFFNIPLVIYYGSATGAPWGAKSINNYTPTYSYPPAIIDVTDNSIADWNNVPNEYLFTAVRPVDAAYGGLKSLKVYADANYIFILVEPDMTEITDLSIVPFQIFINADNNDETGGCWVFPDLNADILIDGNLYEDGTTCSYTPSVFKWWGEAGGSGWEWSDPSMEHNANDCYGAIVCQGDQSGVRSQFVDGKFEIQIARDLIPTVWDEREFGIGVAIEQNWSAVGILPLVSATELNPGLTNKLQVSIDNSNKIKKVFVDSVYYVLNDNAHIAQVLPHYYMGDITILPSVVYEDQSYQVISIARQSFMPALALESVTMSATITNIGDSAFVNCGVLNSLTCEATTPPTLGENVFTGVDKSIPLYVPGESITLYQAADQWKEFYNIQAIGSPSGIVDVNNTTTPRKVMIDGQIFILRGEKVYTLQGQEVK